jgi:hypothetical protein
MRSDSQTSTQEQPLDEASFLQKKQNFELAILQEELRTKTEKTATQRQMTMLVEKKNKVLQKRLNAEENS